jgi:hypothetical protein
VNDFNVLGSLEVDLFNLVIGFGMAFVREVNWTLIVTVGVVLKLLRFLEFVRVPFAGTWKAVERLRTSTLFELSTGLCYTLVNS